MQSIITLALVSLLLSACPQPAHQVALPDAHSKWDRYEIRGASLTVMVDPNTMSPL